MELKGTAKLLRVFIGEADRVGHTPLYELIVREARRLGLAGATVCQGMLSYGPTSRLRTTKSLELSTDLPIIIEIVDAEEKIELLLPLLHDLFEKAGCGGLVTMEKVEVIRYLHGDKAAPRVP
jgi:uncharacterized protein